MNVRDLIVTEEAQNGFYPTPPSLASRLLADVDWRKVNEVLEPSAGKGDIVRQALKEYKAEYAYWRNAHLRIDCIEIDPYLRSILKYEFGGQKAKDLFRQIKEYEDKKSYDIETRSYRKLTDKEKAEQAALQDEYDVLNIAEMCIVHDNFLTFDSRKSYGLIVMNPPFSNGDEHLLKAISMQEEDGGQIRCILNAETLRNPYTNRRMLLVRKLQELNAEVEFLENAFSDGERQTDVEVALIKIDIPIPKRNSTIFERLKKAAEINNPVPDDVTDMTVADFMDRIVTQFNVEVDAGISLINEYVAMKPYILNSFNDGKNVGSPTICVMVKGDSAYESYPSVNNYIKLVRAKYWEALFSNKEFVGKLTNNLVQRYRKKVEALSDYDFTAFNIQQVAEEMNAEMNSGIQETIVNLFDKFTQEHTWYPECAKNIHYYNGWKTNKAHKVNSKVIVPISGVFSDYSWSKEAFNVRQAESLISDIEKVFNYLDGNRTENVDLHDVLLKACEAGRTKGIVCKYFDVTLYKKGTMHIKFRDLEILDKFNIYCSRQKNWLPPNYGKANYSEMNDEEKVAVDGFNGDGTSGSGEESYKMVVAKSNFYLSEPGGDIKMIAAPGM